MDETHRILMQQHELMTYAFMFLGFLGIVATTALAWVMWLTRNMGREGREFQEELARRSARLDYYLFGKLGPLDAK